MEMRLPGGFQIKIEKKPKQNIPKFTSEQDKAGKKAKERAREKQEQWSAERKKGEVEAERAFANKGFYIGTQVDLPPDLEGGKKRKDWTINEFFMDHPDKLKNIPSAKLYGPNGGMATFTLEELEKIRAEKVISLQPEEKKPDTEEKAA